MCARQGREARGLASTDTRPGPAPPGLRAPPAMESGGGGRRGPAGQEEPSLRQPLPPGEAEEEEEEEALLPLPPEAETDWSFVDGEMDAVALRDLPTATIACNLDPRVFHDGPCRVSAAAGRARPTAGGTARQGRLPLPASNRRRRLPPVWGAAACSGGGRCGPAVAGGGPPPPGARRAPAPSGGGEGTGRGGGPASPPAALTPSACRGAPGRWPSLSAGAGSSLGFSLTRGPCGGSARPIHPPADVGQGEEVHRAEGGGKPLPWTALLRGPAAC